MNMTIKTAPNRAEWIDFSLSTVPEQWTNVSLPVKLVKLLVSDLQNQLESQNIASHEADSDSEVMMTLGYCYRLASPAL